MKTRGGYCVRKCLVLVIKKVLMFKARMLNTFQILMSYCFKMNVGCSFIAIHNTILISFFYHFIVIIIKLRQEVNVKIMMVQGCVLIQETFYFERRYGWNKRRIWGSREHNCVFINTLCRLKCLKSVLALKWHHAYLCLLSLFESNLFKLWNHVIISKINSIGS